MGLGMTPFHGALTAAATIAAATAIHLGLRRMRCRLPHRAVRPPIDRSE